MATAPAPASSAPPQLDIDPARVAAVVKGIYGNLNLIMHVPDEVLLFCILCLLAEGHILLEDMPGTGKTTLANALARSTGLSVARIQFSPDLVAADVVGTRHFDQNLGRYDLKPGPIFSNIVVADEINRAAPHTQAVMLECMQEKQVTFGMVSYEIKRPFLVLATQNPVDKGEGTYALPAAQLDRFMVKMSLGYPPPESEAKLVLEQAAPDPLERLKPVTDQTEIKRVLADVRLVHASEAVAEYVVAVLVAGREDKRLELGASPRSGITVMRLAKAYALAFGRNEVSIDDVRAVAPAAVAHRLIRKPDVDIPQRELVVEHMQQANSKSQAIHPAR